MEEAQGLSWCVVNKKAVGIAKNSHISLKLAAPLGTLNPECLHPVLAAWFRAIMLNKGCGNRCSYQWLSEHPAPVLQHHHLDEDLIVCHFPGGLWGGGKVAVICRMCKKTLTLGLPACVWFLHWTLPVILNHVNLRFLKNRGAFWLSDFKMKVGRFPPSFIKGVTEVRRCEF